MFGLKLSGLPLETLAWMAGGAALIVTLLYLLKLRKRRVQVPFSPLWGKVLAEYRQQSDWWKRLRRLLSWLLQILLILALIFALADPHPEGQIIEGRHMMILLDSSASMAATDVSGGIDRMDIARKKAREILETVGPEDRVMLVNFNQQLQPLSPFVEEVKLLEQPLQDIQVTDTATSFDTALAFAAASLRDKERAELIILSDGAGFEPEQMEGLDFGAQTTVRHIKVGESGGNVAVTAFSVRRYLANRLDYELFAQVQSHFDRPVAVALEIWADGRLVDTKPLQLEAMGTAQQFFPAQAIAGERLEARVRVTTADARDVMPRDDRAFALLPPVKQSRVLLVSAGNLYLEGTLLLNANVALEVVAPDAYDPAKPYDVVFFDRVAPPALPERGHFVYFAPPPDGPWEITGSLKAPIINTYKKSHPLMRWLGMRDVNIGTASRLKLAKDDEVVASSFGAPMIIARRDGERSLVAVAFDVRDSDLPLRVAFPVLMINLIDAAQLDDDSLIQNFTTGQTWSVQLPVKEGTAQVLAPGATAAREVPIYEGRAMVYGEQAGFYEVRSGEALARVAANLSSTRESQIMPRELTSASAEITRDTSGLFFDRRELWIWAVLIALGLLALEWWTYNRRLTV